MTDPGLIIHSDPIPDMGMQLIDNLLSIYLPIMQIQVGTVDRIISNHEIVEVRQRAKDGQHGIYANRSWNPGEVITLFSAATYSSEPTYLTIQTGESLHITLDPEFLQYTNHSCDPNVFFDTALMELVALNFIHPGDELTFFYPSTEWVMRQPFDCFCESHQCLGKIRGARYLKKNVRKRFRFTAFILDQFGKSFKGNSKVA